MLDKRKAWILKRMWQWMLTRRVTIEYKELSAIDAKHKKWLVVLNRRIAIDTEGG